MAARRRERRWVYVGNRSGRRPSDAERRAITAACEKLIAEVLKPRFLPEIRPSTEFNYPVDIYGKWHGHRYRFIQRFRCDYADALVPEFEAGFARLDWVAPDRFDLFYHRHTGQWRRLYRYIPLAEALRRIENEGHFHPL